MELKEAQMKVDTQTFSSAETSANFKENLAVIIRMSAQRLDFPI